jgi:hypothetical protein
MKIIYRDTLPKDQVVDIIFIALVHQGKDILNYMIRNVKKYVQGKYLLLIHYNGRESINENELPEWVWLSRTPVNTDRCSITMTIATCELLKFGLDNISFTNAFILSSGAAFYRTYHPPTTPYIGIITHETILYPNSNFIHVSPISTEHLGKVADYLVKNGGSKWQYENCDRDVEFLNFVKKRNFKWLKGSQFTGQIWPKEVAKQIVEDILTLRSNNDILSTKNNSRKDYAYEEIYFSSYAYNYAIENQIPVSPCEVIIDWSYYEIQDPKYIVKMRDYKVNDEEIGHALCKVPDNVNHPSRIFLDE